MKKSSSLSEYSNELIASSYLNGIKLIDPIFNNNTGFVSASTLMSMPFNVYFKSKESVMVVVNELTESTCGPAGTICGSWSKDARQAILAHDKKILTFEHKEIFEEEGPNPDGSMHSALSLKLPWYGKDDRVVGIFGCTIIFDKDNGSIATPLSSLMNTGLLGSPSTHSKRQLISTNQSLLSKREMECLYHLVRGKTAKEIAKKLGLSFRTVEAYLNNIKIKLNVTTRSELIEKAFELYIIQ